MLLLDLGEGRKCVVAKHKVKDHQLFLQRSGADYRVGVLLVLLFLAFLYALVNHNAVVLTHEQIAQLYILLLRHVVSVGH